jgi:hypothetical protein
MIALVVVAWIAFTFGVLFAALLNIAHEES